MAPPSSAPKLARIDPKQLGVDTVRKVLVHIEEQTRRLGLRETIRVPINAPEADLAASDLALTVADLANYAKMGGSAADLDDQASDVLAAVSSSVGDAGRILEDFGVTADDLQDPLSLVMAAAYSRRDITEGVETQPVGLAALAGLSARQLWHLVRQDELKAQENGAISAAIARRWLAGRGVPGFDLKAKK